MMQIISSALCENPLLILMPPQILHNLIFFNPKRKLCLMYSKIYQSTFCGFIGRGMLFSFLVKSLADQTEA